MHGRAWFVLPTLLLVAWGALAFGAVYPWAYVPLLGGCALVGLGGLAGGRGSWFREARPVAVALLVVAIGVLVQVIPLPLGLLNRISPATSRFLTQYDLGFVFQRLPGAAEAAGTPGAAWHALSIRPQSTLVGLAFLLVLGLFLLGLSFAFARHGLRRTVQGIVFLGVVLALVGIIQKSVLGDHAFGGMRIYGLWQPKSLLVTPFGPFVNKNHFAGWMLMAIPLALGWLCALVEHGRGSARGLRDRILWLSTPPGGQFLLACLAIVVMALALFMTRSRSGIASFAVAMLLAGTVAATSLRGRAARVGVVTLLAVLFLLPVAWLGADVALGRFVAGGSEIQIRLAAWRAALGILADFPVAGSGLNTFHVASVLYESHALGLHFDQAHNDYLQLMAEGGLLLGIPIAIALVALAGTVRRRLTSGDDDPTTRWLRVGAVIGIVAIAIQSLVEFSLQMPGNAVLFTVLAAAAIHRSAAAPRTDSYPASTA